MPPKPSKKAGSSILSFFRGASSTSESPRRPSTTEPGTQADPLVIDSDSDGDGNIRKEPPRKRRKPSSPKDRIYAKEELEEDGFELLVTDPKEEAGSGSDDDAAEALVDSECPVCGTSLSVMSSSESGRHVNSCLDRPPRPITSISHRIIEPRSPSPELVKKGGKPAANAFSVLMNSHKEKEMWKDVDNGETRDGRRFGPRKAPFYKILTGMPIAVDAFCYGAVPKVTAHAHADHYTNLSKSWKHGPIYCSYTTANLVVLKLGVDPQWVHGLPDDEEFVIPDTGGVAVTLIEANHCPGSSIFLFEGPQTVHAGDSTYRSAYVGTKKVFRYLHCGDFRACPKHVLHPAVARAPLDTVYLDTTYLNPQYCFPPQPLVIEACAALARRAALGDELPTEAKPDVKSELGVIPDDEDNIDPDVGLDDFAGTGVGDANEDDKPDTLNLGAPTPIEEEPDEATIDAKPDVKLDPEMKPDVESEVKPEVEPNVKPDIKPDIKPDVKPELKPFIHPVEATFAEEDRSAAMMSGWLVRKNADGSVAPPKPKGRMLVLIGTYSIGKERIVKGVAHALGSKIYCDPRKRQLLMCQADPELHAMLEEDPTKCQVHLVPLQNISLDNLEPYLNALKPHFDRILAFRPTGWTYRPPAGANTLPDVNFVIKRDQAQGFSDVSLRPIRGSSRQFMMFGVPYSEHSSFFELTCFVLSCPGADVKVIATVNVHTEKSRMKMKKWFEKWASEKSKRKARGQPAIVDYRDETYW